MYDQALVAVVGQDLAQILDEPELRHHLTKEQGFPFAADVALINGGLDLSGAKAEKMKLRRGGAARRWRGLLWFPMSHRQSW
jgi:hypothetical protein